LPELKECQCGQVLESNWKVCPICEKPVTNDKIPTDNERTVIGSGGSVIGRVYNSKNTYNTFETEPGDALHKMEFEYENQVILILRGGGNLQAASIELEKIRERLRLTLGKAKEIETECLKRYPESSILNKPYNANIPFKLGDPDYNYRGFFNDIREKIIPYLPASGDSDGHYWYRIPTSVEGAHFEYYFEFRKWRRLGVELHFETRNSRWNQAMLEEMIKYTQIIEQNTAERVYIERNWGRPVVWSRLYLANTRLDDVDALKKWAADKMIIFYQTLQPRLNNLR